MSKWSNPICGVRILFISREDKLAAQLLTKFSSWKNWLQLGVLSKTMLRCCPVTSAGFCEYCCCCAVKLFRKRNNIRITFLSSIFLIWPFLNSALRISFISLRKSESSHWIIICVAALCENSFHSLWFMIYLWLSALTFVQQFRMGSSLFTPPSCPNVYKTPFVSKNIQTELYPCERSDRVHLLLSGS